MIYSIAVLLLAGLVVGKLANLVKLPAVTGYVVAGLLLGPSLLGAVSQNTLEQLSMIEGIALSIIALAIGGELRLATLRRFGTSVLIITMAQSLGAFVLVFFTFWALGAIFSWALFWGAISTATAPAATLAVVKEYQAKGVLTNTILAVVALDDAVCIIIFSLAAAFAGMMGAGGGFSWGILLAPVREITLSIVLGAVLGLGVCYLVRKLKDSEILILMLGTALLAAGIAEQFALSPLLTNMALGAVFSNLSARERTVFYLVENVEPPIYTLFFVFAGTQLQLGSLINIGLVGVGYVLARALGKVGGAYLGAKFSHAPASVRKYLGFALLPQAGVAIGLALIGGQQFPNLRELLVTVVLAAVVIHEIIGPLAAKQAIVKSGEAGRE